MSLGWNGGYRGFSEVSEAGVRGFGSRTKRKVFMLLKKKGDQKTALFVFVFLRYTTFCNQFLAETKRFANIGFFGTMRFTEKFF